MNAKNSSKRSETDWEFLASDSDEGIDFSDIPKLGADFWKNAKPRMPQKKDSVTIRLDRDMLDWFRGMGGGYQTKINAVLRSYMRSVRHS
jgi:uncharacterized protein (DUF4415 family)